MSNQLVKRDYLEGYRKVFPKTFIDAIKDRDSGMSLAEILQGFNMYFLSYNGNKALTRCSIPKSLRKEGLWITYVLYDHTVITEWYNSDNIEDEAFGSDDNWRIASNILVGDISVSSDGYWVIKGEKTTSKAQGETGITPLLRIGSNNKLQVTYNEGKEWRDISDYIVPKFRWTQGSGNTIGHIQISMDLGATWNSISGDITNNIKISKYIGINEALPTSGIAEGTIYMKGPYYDENDINNDNPIYRMWVYAWKDNTLAWQDNGEFTSISAGVVQERGTSTTEVMSQDAVTRELTELESEKTPITSIYGEDVILGYGLTNDSLQKDEGVLISPFISVVKGDSIVWTHRFQSSNNFVAVAYDSNKQILDTWSAGETGGRSISVSIDNVAYFRFTMNNASAYEAFVSVNETKVWNDSIYKTSLKGYIDNIIEEAVNDIAEIDKRLDTAESKSTLTDEKLAELESEKAQSASVYGEDVILGYGLTTDAQNNVILFKDGGVIISPFIPIVKGDSVEWVHRFQASNNFRAVMYDSNKQKLESWGAGAGGYRTISVSNDNAAYFRFTMNNAYDYEAFVSVNGTKVWNDSFYKKTIKERIERIGAITETELNERLSSIENKASELESTTSLKLADLEQGKSDNNSIFGEDVILDFALLTDNGIEKANGYLITPYLSVKNGDSVTVTHRISTSTPYRIVVYDSELKMLGSWGVGTGGRSITIERDDAIFLRATMYSASADQAFISINGTKVWNDSFYKKSVKEHIEGINEDVKDLQSLHKDNILIPALPDYYFASDYIDTKVKVINEEIRKCSNNGDIFFWMTDTHWEADRNTRMSASLINYIRQRTNIIRLFNGGDNHDGVWSDTNNDGALNYINSMKQALGTNKIYIAYGNHEFINGEDYAEIFYASRQHNDDVVFGDVNKSYFYTENEQQKIRYIILTPFGPTDAVGGYSSVYGEDAEQLDWLRNVALNVEDDWTCLIFTHAVFIATNTRAIAPRYIADVKEYYGEPWSGVIWWIDAINNYKEETKGIVVDATGLSESTSRPSDRFGIRLVYDRQENNTYIYRRYMCKREWVSAEQVFKYRWYEFGLYTSDTLLNIGDEVIVWKGSKGTLAGVIQGHSHKDWIHISPTGVPHVLSACDKWTAGISADGVSDLDVERIPGTRSENHFEVVVLNKNIRQLTFIAIGAKSTNSIDDKLGEEVEIRSVSY